MPPQQSRKDPQPVEPDEAPASGVEQLANDGTSGRSGRGSESVLTHLIEQEKNRVRKPERE